MALDSIKANASENPTAFVELNRWFVPIEKDREPNLDIGRAWGRKVAGWLDWADLRNCRRVVLLAEAHSGKSEEFRHQAESLSSDGKAAFYLRIEELADQGFDAALEPNAANHFQEWRHGAGQGWFFLDSVDEARLNGKSLDTALKRFTRALDESLERARVFISCRVSDWRGRDDRSLIERRLPAFETAVEPPTSQEKNSSLLSPIFGADDTNPILKQDRSNRSPTELVVVQLVPLSTEQARILAEARGVANISAFVKAIEHSGFDAFTERPGNVLELADYWHSYNKFGSFAEMMEHSIARKLREPDPFRLDSNTISFVRARRGAERLAAALTFGKSFTLRAPDHDPDPSLTSGALDPSIILDDWTEAARAALTRRGVFSPSTYGRLRFHHRSTQEYLTAEWLHRLLEENCPRSEIWDLIFADRYGVQTVVPSLRSAAAWLALKHPDFREEIIRREPLILIRHGDPGLLPLDAKERLLAAYASKHAAGEISDDSLDHRAIWMFADAGLATAIRRAWQFNSHPDFRLHLLRLIREGAIGACGDLAKRVALNPKAGDYHRIVVLGALDACGDHASLSKIARRLVNSTSKKTARLAGQFGRVLFPAHLSVDELLGTDRRMPAGTPELARGVLPGTTEFLRSVSGRRLASSSSCWLGEALPSETVCRRP